jgi:hypothetical protein
MIVNRGFILNDNEDKSIEKLIKQNNDDQEYEILLDNESNYNTTIKSKKIIRKDKLDGNLKSNIYSLTDKGLDLLPVIAELTLWSDAHVRELNLIMTKGDYQYIKNNKKKFLDGVLQSYQKSII